MERQRDTLEDADARSDMFPDRTMSDYYCKICDAHMNSEQMWESHVSGKRHLKNVKKEPGEMPSKVRAIKVSTYPKLMDAIKNVSEPLVGLGFMTELQRADPLLNPSYTCHLCQANCTWSVVIEHILGTKHRLAYLKVVDPEQYDIIENMELKKTSLDQLAEDRAREYERKTGCGTMEVKLEKPKVAPPPPKREKGDEELATGHHSLSLSSGSRKASPDEIYIERRNRSRSPPHRYLHQSPPPYRRKRHDPPVDGKWQHDRYSPEVRSPVPIRVPHAVRSNGLPDITSFTMSEKINCLQQICRNLILVSEVEVQETEKAIITLAHNMLQFKIRQLPLTKQEEIAKLLVIDKKNLRKELHPTLKFVFDAVSTVLPSSSNYRDHHHHHHRRSSSSSSSRKRY